VLVLDLEEIRVGGQNHRMASTTRTLLVLAGAIGGAVAVLTACITDYQKGLDDPSYGDPNALAGQRQPGPSSENVGGEGGASGGVSSVVCVANGETLIDGGACDVSFLTDVLGAFGRSNCASTPSCHQGVSPANLPRIEPSDGPGMWAEFAGFKMSDGKPYINPCSTDKAAAGIACNLYETGGCGVHMPQGGQMPPEDIELIDRWLECGSPNN
jgi:hypothetical protein